MKTRKVHSTLFLILALIFITVATTAAQTNKSFSKRPGPKTGTILAGVYAYCTSSGSRIQRSFNNVNNTPITISDGSSLGYCTIDFGFDVSDRYIIATVTHPGTALGVNVYGPSPIPTPASTVQFFVWHAGNGVAVLGGDIFVMI